MESKLSLSFQRSNTKSSSKNYHFQLSFLESLNCVKIIVKSAIPTSFTFIVNTFTGIFLFKNIGIYGTPNELAGASIGYTLVNIFCFGIFFSIDLGFSVIAAKLFGAKKLKELGVLYQRNLSLIAALAIPLFSLLLMANNILVFLGVDPEVALNTGIYIRHIIPSIIGTCIFNSTRFFLISQNVFNVQGIILAILAPIHIVWCEVFVGNTSSTIAGAAIAKSITDMSAATILLLYIKFSGVCGEAWTSWTRESLKGWVSHLKETLILGGNLYVDLISVEASVLVISLLNDVYVLGAQGVADNFVYAVFMLTVGTTISMHAYMGNAVGEGSVDKAKNYLISGLLVNGVIAFFNSLLMIIFCKDIAMFFISDEKGASILQNMFLIYGFSHITETMINGIGGALRIMGEERLVLTSFAVCYFGIAFNCQWLFGVALEFGYMAIWLSRAAATYLLLFIMVKNILKLNWEEEIKKVRNELIVRDQEANYYIELTESHGKTKTISSI